MTVNVHDDSEGDHVFKSVELRLREVALIFSARKECSLWLDCKPTGSTENYIIKFQNGFETD